MASPLLFVGPIDRVLFLQALPVYRDLGVGYLAAIAQHSRERFLRSGVPWHAAGEPLTAMAFVVEGGLVVERPDRAPERVGSGEVVGLLSLLARRSGELTIRAESATLLLEVGWEAQIDLCEEYFPVVDQYLRFLARAGAGTPAPADAGRRLDLPPIPPDRALDLVERLEALTAAAVLPAHGLDALTELARHVTELRWGAGHELWKAGDEAESFVLVLEGEIVEGTGADRLVVGSGGVVGMTAALGRDPRTAAAETAGSVVGLSIELEAFLDILEDHFDVAIDLLAAQARAVLSRPHGR